MENQHETARYDCLRDVLRLPARRVTIACETRYDCGTTQKMIILNLDILYFEFNCLPLPP